MDLLIQQIQTIDLNLETMPMIGDVNWNVFNQILFQKKHKSIEALTDLKEITNKRKFNQKIRHILAGKLYFLSLQLTMKRNLSMY